MIRATRVDSGTVDAFRVVKCFGWFSAGIPGVSVPRQDVCVTTDRALALQLRQG